MTGSGKLDGATVEALLARGLEPEVVAKQGWWSEPAASGGGSVVAIPFRRDGKIVNVKYRTSLVMGGGGRMWQSKGGAQIFYNEDALRDDTLLGQPVIITEGEPDCVAALQSGFLRVVSVPSGAPDQQVAVEHEGPKYDFLKEAKDLLSIDRCPAIILAVDNDEKGANLLHDLSVRLGRFRCKFLTYPMDPKDPGRRLKDLNEVLLRFGEKGVNATIARAQWMKVDGVYRMSELPPVPTPLAYDCGFDVLRDHMKIRLGDFWVVTGIPSMGKTTFVNDLCCRLVANHRLNIAFGSWEQLPQVDHRRNLRTWRAMRPISQQLPQETAEADQWIDKHFSFIVPSEDDDVTLDWLFDRMEAAVVQHAVKVIVIDPWNEMDHQRERNETQTEYVGRAIKAFKRFAKKFRVLVIIVAHPAKMQKQADGSYSMPSLYDISDSANWFNKADLGVVVHRLSTHSVIRVAKSRYHDEIGVPGEVEATYVPEQRRYTIWKASVDD